MRPALLLSFFLALFLSCSNIDEVKPGMTQQQVIDVMGKPDDVLPVARMNEDLQMENITIWQYGANQGVIWKDGKVDQVITDIDQLMREIENQK